MLGGRLFFLLENYTSKNIESYIFGLNWPYNTIMFIIEINIINIGYALIPNSRNFQKYYSIHIYMGLRY
jgi:hypothetical protein